MGKLLDRVLDRPQAAGIEDPTYPLTSEYLLDALHIPWQTASSIRVTEKKSLGMPAVWRAVNLISSTGASLPLYPFKDNLLPGWAQPVPERQVSGYAAELLANPHPDMTPFELWELCYGHVALWGNAYLRKLRDRNGIVRELWGIHPSRVKPGRASDLTKVYEVDNGEPFGGRDYTDYEILHIPGFGYDGVCGLSPIQVAAKQGVGLALAAEEFGARFFGAGSMAAGILQTDRVLKKEQADALKDRWRARIGGLDNAHEIAILDAGAKFQQLTIPPEAAQFLQSRSFQVEEVARIYGVPPILLMAMEKATSWGTGVEQMMLGWVKFGLRPTWLTRFEQRVTKVLTPRPVYARYDLDELLRGDSAQQAAYFKQMWEIGAFSSNIVKAKLGLPPVEGGDTHWRPSNYAPITDTTTIHPPAPGNARAELEEVPHGA